MEWVEYTCRRFKAHRLLIEAKGPGQSAAQELSNRFGILDFVVDPTPVKGDKLSRALAVQANFANGVVYAPNRDWAELVIGEMEVFPKGRYDDLTDSTTQAIKYIRDNGLLQTDEETRHEELRSVVRKRALAGNQRPNENASPPPAKSPPPPGPETGPHPNE
jgi:predicted phage terminase large subunit-like protein